MRQRELVDDTKEYLLPSDKKIRGIIIHQNYSEIITSIMFLIVIGSFVSWFFFGYRTLLIATGIAIVVAFGIELVLRLLYRFNGKEATTYYALKLAEEPNETYYKQLHSWNKNPFNLTNEYYYQRLGQLVNTSKQKDNPVEYAHNNIPDELRLIEHHERTDYNVLMDLEFFKEYPLSDYYEGLIQEINYTYKFGSYMSASILLRKLAEHLLEEILLAKGLGEKIGEETTFNDLVEIFVESAISDNLDEDIRNNLEQALDVWIRKKGNKGAHVRENFTKDEIETLMEKAQQSIRLLVVIRSQYDVDKIQTN